MSFVIGFAYGKQIIIKSDGRVIDSSETNIVNESYNKTRRISDSLICGFTGNKSLCECIYNDFLSATESIHNNINADIAICKLNDVVKEYVTKYPAFLVAFLIGGLSDSGIPTLNSFKSDAITDITYNRASSQEIAVTALEPKGFEGKGPSILSKYLLAKHTIDDALNLAIKEVADGSFSVNTNIFSEEIRL